MIENATVREVELELARLRDEATEPGEPPTVRASALTHVAWVPERWQEKALDALAGLAERHPSRGIVLLPRPDDPRDELDAEVTVRCFPSTTSDREACAEVIALRLNGPRAASPGSVALPLLLADQPVFLRWRGDLPFGAPELEQLLALADRLIVDSGEWSEPEEGFRRLAGLVPRLPVSDIAWSRIEPWRRGLASRWPGVAEPSALRVRGPEAEALLLVRWLGARLGREVALEREPAEEVELVEVDGAAVRPRHVERRTASDLLSQQLDQFGRDPVYEEALRTFAPATA